MPPPERFASRFLLPMEMLLGWISIGWVIGGLLGRGVFADAVARSEISSFFFLLLACWGIALVMVARLELILGRSWGDRTLRWSCESRAYLGWIGLMLWFIVVYLLVQFPVFRQVLSFMWSAPAMMLGCGAMAWHNSRTAILLNPRISTECLKARIIQERLKRWGAL